MSLLYRMLKKTKKNKKRQRRKLSRKCRAYKKTRGGGNTGIPICIYSHSSHFDILQIQVDYLNKVFKDTVQKIYLFLDKEFTMPKDMNYTIIIYDENLVYTKRILYCIEKVGAPYFILSQESDIIVRYNSDAIKALTETMGRMNIDSVDLLIRDLKCEKQEKITDSLFITNLKGGSWHLSRNFVYSVQPRLWKKESAIQFFSSIGDATYKEVERAETQKYITENQTTYGLCSTNPMMSYGLLSKSFPAVEEYIFLHVTQNGKFVSRPSEKDAVHPEIAAIEKELYDQYIQGATGREKIHINDSDVVAYVKND